MLGIIRHTDNLGRIVIPKELRKTYNIGDMEQVVITPMNEGILITRYDDYNIVHDLQLVSEKYAMDGINNAIVDELNQFIEQIKNV